MKYLDLLTIVCFCLTALFSSSSAKTDHQFRIAGGEEALPRQFPVIVALNVRTEDSVHFCQGTIVNNNYIITSAYCIYRATYVTALLGATSLVKNDSNTLVVTTSYVFPHPDFNPQTFENDIGLIKMRERLTSTAYYHPIYLLDDPRVGEEVLAVGWGQTDGSSEISPDLMFARMTIISDYECKLYYGNQIKDGMVCALGVYTEGICYGDSGGPLLLALQRQWILVAIASFFSSYGCGSGHPSGFTDVMYHIVWIVQTMNENGP